MKFNWRTLFSSGGIGYLAFDTLAKILDGDPLTNPNWGILVAAVVTTGAALFTQVPGSK